MTQANVQFERILCPTDFSAFSRRALDHALRIATWFRSDVTVLAVMPPVEIGYLPPEAGFVSAEVLQEARRAQREKCLADLDHFVAPHRKGAVKIATRLVEGDPASEIEAAARALPADLLVMGTHGYGGFRRLLLGSVTERLLRTAPCPVLTTGDALPAASSGLLFRRILCPVDLTATSGRTFGVAVSLAEENLARLTLLHVVESLPPEHSAKLYLSVPELSALRGDLRKEGLGKLEDLARQARPFCEVQTRVEFGPAWESVVQEARESAADLIVVGAHERGTLAGLFLGGTTNHLVREAPCPVLVVRETARSARGSEQLAAAHAAR